MARLTPEQKIEQSRRNETIVKMRKASYSLREIGKIYGITHSRVAQICKALENSVSLEKVEVSK